jgi:2,5-diamino-6-(ribosylamino)-4(3H)-pyrimidinone 5'-phosphate reductase
MNRPQVIVNCAMSADGKIALPTRKQMRISCEEDIKRMYQLRNDCDAVLVGVGTILADDPKLTVKETYVSKPKQPLRVILDSKGRTPSDALALNTAAKTLLITARGNEKRYKGSHIEVVECPTVSNGFLDVHCVLEMLFNKGIRKLLVEGGGTVIWNFLANKVVDDMFLYIGPCIIGGAGTPTVADGEGIRNEAECISLRIVEIKRLGPGLLVHYQLG